MSLKKNNELPAGIINPFSGNFLEKWQLWKDYRWDEHKFKYKGVFSEQAALMKLNDLSGGDEEKAWKIIKQSMEGPWRGLFPLHENNNKNGKSVTETRKDVTDVLGARDYETRRN
jgi:hypothetical protein